MGEKNHFEGAAERRLGMVLWPMRAYLILQSAIISNAGKGNTRGWRGGEKATSKGRLSSVLYA